jgi:hypothetical protein
VSVATTEIPLAVSNGEVILIVVAIAIPISALAFVLGAGDALRQIGKGQFGVEFDADLRPTLPGSGTATDPPPAVREAEIRQMLEAKAFRQASRGEPPLDVEAELERLLAETPPAPTAGDRALRVEVRQLVVARNERRARQGKEPLDVEAEVNRQLRELENLGQ